MTPSSLPELLASRAEERAEQPLLRMRAGTFTFAEIEESSSRMAGGLRELGIDSDHVVASLLPNSPEAVLTWLATQRLGAVYAPINIEFRGASLAHVVNLVDPGVLVVDETLATALGDVVRDLARVPTLVVRGDSECAAEAVPGANAVSLASLEAATPQGLRAPGAPGDVAMLLFTSGTTGRSKACAVSHRYTLRQAEILTSQLGLGEEDTFYSPFPLYHVDASIFTFVPAVQRGTAAALGERFSVRNFWQEIRDFGATTFDFMGATLAMLFGQPARDDDATNPARLAWGVPMPDFADEFERRFDLRLTELYGLTDAGHVAYQPVDVPRRAGSCGRPIAPFDVRIHDAAAHEAAVGETGEIVVRPVEPGLILNEYFRMPEATVAAFKDLWFHTGDLGHLDSDGWLYFDGRLKDAIRRRGENISAAEIEEVIAAHPAVEGVAAIGVPSALTEEDVKVCVVLRPGSALSPEQLIQFCKGRMARYMIPRYVEFLEELPKTPTAKVQKFLLRERGVTSATWDREELDSSLDARSPKDPKLPSGMR